MENHSLCSVAVYCASSSLIPSVYIEAATRLGQLLGERKLRVVNGAGSSGLMGALSDSVMKAGGTVTGVIPEFMKERNWHSEMLTELIVTRDMHERKRRMAELSDAVIAMPGGYGTLEELMEIITWKQLGLYRNPVIILNVNHFYDPLLEMFEKFVVQRFMCRNHLALWNVADTPEEAIEKIDRLFAIM